MDDLIEKLGYLDYRDALAANKYILDAKKNGDYYQQARAKTLSLALARMSRLKKEQYEKKVSVKLANQPSEVKDDRDVRDKIKLENIMADDSLVANAYQEMF